MCKSHGRMDILSDSLQIWGHSDLVSHVKVDLTERYKFSEELEKLPSVMPWYPQTLNPTSAVEIQNLKSAALIITK